MISLLTASVFLSSLMSPSVSVGPINDPDIVIQKQWHATNEGESFDITGNIALVCGGEMLCIDILANGRICQYWIAPNNISGDIRSGQRVRMKGHLRRPNATIPDESHAPLLAIVEEIHSLGPSAPILFDNISGGQLNCGEFTNITVCVKGIVSCTKRDNLDSNWNWFILRTPTGKVRVATPERENPLETLQNMTDAEVLVKGVVSRSGHLRSFLGFLLLPMGSSSISILTSPQTNVLVHPTPPTRYMGKMSILDARRPNILHRQRISGLVLGEGDGRYFIKTSDDGFCAVLSRDQKHNIKPGNQITAIGFVEHGPCCLELSDATILTDTIASNPLPAGIEIKASELFTENKENVITDPIHYGKILRLQGTVSNTRENMLHDGIISLSCDVYTIQFNIKHLLPQLHDLPDSGWKMSVSGVCFGGFNTCLSDGDFPIFKGFSIYPRTTDDIVIVSRPSWWTSERLLVVILVLALTIIAILAWTRSLAILSAKRGKRLYQEAIAHTKAEIKVKERTDLAIELHDALSQTLTGIALQIDSASLANHGGNARVGQVLEVAKSMLSSCRKELHNCLWDLRSRTFEENDMTEAVTHTLAQYSDGRKISVRFNVPRNIFEETQSYAILRMVRELVINAISHGHATRLWIAGEYHDGTVSFSVRDNGCGFDPSAVPGPPQGHFGLQGIRERLEKVNGKLTIMSARGKGSKISLRFSI